MTYKYLCTTDISFCNCLLPILVMLRGGKPCFFTLQKRNRKATIRLIIVPIYLCVLLSVLQRVINNLLDKPKYKCGCRCVDLNGTGPCQNVCGIQYSTLDQAGSCPIPNPPEWPTLLQVPRPEYRAIEDSSESCRQSQSCLATIPFTGANETLSTSK